MLKTVKIYPAVDSVKMESATKVLKLEGCKSVLDAVSMALQKIEIPCKIEIFSDHVVLKRLVAEIDKGTHNINEICEGGFNKYEVIGLLQLMKKIRNIILTDR